MLACTISCSKRNAKVVVAYTSVDQVFSEPLFRDFERDTGIKVKAVFDTEETKSTGILNRLIAEKDNPQCDVFWSGDPIRVIILKNKGITQAYNSKTASDIASHYKGKEFHWIGFSARARVLMYNTKLLKRKNAPRSIFDLADKRFKGHITVANPLFGTTSFHFAALFSSIGNQRAKKFLADLKKNKVVIASSNGDVRRRVVSGEFWCGLTDSDDYFTAKNQKAPVDIIFLDQQGMGNLVMPNSVSLIKNSPNRKNGKLLIDYLLSKKTEQKLALSCAQMPLHKGVRIGKNVLSLDNIVPMKVDYEKTAKKLEEIQGYLKKWVRKK